MCEHSPHGERRAVIEVTHAHGIGGAESASQILPEWDSVSLPAE